MIVIDDIRACDALPAPLDSKPVCITVGSFDGVHRGHQRILEETRALANEMGGCTAVVTMRPHPRRFFSPDHAPNLLTTDAKKIELLADLGMDAVFFLPFDAETASLDREHFVDDILLDKCKARGIVVGHDFSFGKNALGNYGYLKELEDKHDIIVREVPAFLLNGLRVSSTLIRERILLGDLEQAEELLGRPYAIQGEVITGRGVGKKLGYPTANIRPHHSAVPAQGVYAAHAHYNGHRYLAAVNIGIAPTVRQEDLMIEAFLLDFEGDLVGREIELVFHRRLRPEKKFPSYEALTEQIDKDVATVRELLGNASK